MFIVDSSGSIRDQNPADGSYDNWDLVLQFINNLIDDFDIGPDAVQVGMVRFSYESENMWYLNSYYDKNTLKSAVSNMGYVGSWTNTADAIAESYTAQFIPERNDRPDAPNIIVIITDGVPNRNVESTVPNANYAMSLGYEMFAVGVTDAVDYSLLSQLSSMPQQQDINWFTAVDFTALTEIEDAILEASCDGSSVTSSDNWYCRFTEEAGLQCFCKYAECDIRSVNSTQCQNRNECNDGFNGGCGHFCVDTDGSYYCTCDNGYSLSNDFRDCIDNDECIYNPCPSDRTCVNTYGSYYCITNSDVVAGSLALTAESGVVSTSTTTATVATSTLVVGCILAAVCAIMVTMIIVLGVRRYQKSQDLRRLQKSNRSANTLYPGGFNINSKFGAMVVDGGDNISTAPSEFSTIS